MADLGAIGFARGSSAKGTGSAPPSGASPTLYRNLGSRVRVPLYRTSAATSEWGALDATGTLSGTVKEGGTPVPYAVVFCYWRVTGALVAKTVCDAAGAFSFTELDKNSDQYLVVGIDPAGGTQYNAQAYDLLTPL